MLEKQYLSDIEQEFNSSRAGYLLWDKYKDDIQSKVVSTKKLLLFDNFNDTTLDLSRYYVIKKLGLEKSSDENLKKEWLNQAEKETVFPIASICDNFSIKIKFTNGKYCLSIGSDMNQNALHNILDVAYGSSELLEDDISLSSLMTENCKFQKIPCFSVSDKDKPQNKKEYINWLDKISQLNVSCDFSVEMKFGKIDKMFVSSKLEDLKKNYESISVFGKMTLQNSLQRSTNFIDEKVGKIAEIIYQGQDKTNSESKSISFSEDLTNLEIKLLLPQVENQIMLLETANKSQCWTVSSFIACEDSGTKQILKAIINTFAISQGYNTVWNNCGESSYSAIPTDELSNFAKLPEKDFVGFEFVPNEDYYIQPCDNGNVELGDILKNGKKLNQKIQVSYEDLNRHTFICGMTGSGKTNTSFHILSSLDKPFLVIEPVKSEYRNFQLKDEKVNVQTMNSIDANAFIINPFWFPPNSSLQYHIDGLKMLITSALALYSAMPNILEQSLYNVYAKFGWNFATGKNLYEGELPEKYIYPTFSDLYSEIEFYLENSDYSGELLSNYRGALSTRIKSFTTGVKGLLLNTNKHPNYAEWLNSNQVIELDALSDDSDKAIVMGSILIQYFQYLKTLGNQDELLKHIIVIEEAHRLFKNIAANSNPEVANSSGQLVEMLTNMMAEIRAYGEGIIVIDQSPSKIAIDVIKNSNIKIIHRLDSKDDIDLIEQSLLMENSGVAISSLKKGQAFVRFEQLNKPAKILFPKSKGGSTVKNCDVQVDNIIREDDWKRSPVVDVLLQNSDFKVELCVICKKFTNSLLLDALALPNEKTVQINVIIRYCMQHIHNSMMSFGFLADSKIEKSAYNNLILHGTSMVLSNDKMYRNHHKFCSKLNMMIERALLLYFTEDINPREALLFENYRSNALYPMLESIQLNNRETGKRYRDIEISLHKCSLYAPILCSLNDICEKTGVFKSKEDLNWKKSEIFVDMNLLNDFIVLPVQIVSANISQQFYIIIKEFVEFQDSKE